MLLSILAYLFHKSPKRFEKLFIKLNYRFMLVHHKKHFELCNQNSLTYINSYFSEIKTNLISEVCYGGRDRLPKIIFNGNELLDREEMVSIIITSRNSSKTISTALNSVLKQSYVNIEIILVDDFSSDDTLKKSLRIANLSNKKINIFQTKRNYGTYVCRNIGIKIAKGKYVTFHDSDDFMLPGRIEEQMKSHICSKEKIVTISNHIKINDKFKIQSNSLYPLDKICKSSIMLERKFFKWEIGYFLNYKVGSDEEFIQRLIKFHDIKLLRIKKVFTIGLSHENSLTSSYIRKKLFQEKSIKQVDTTYRDYVIKKYALWHKLNQKKNKKPICVFNNQKYKYNKIL